jgi:signal transduction histidine kinase
VPPTTQSHAIEVIARNAAAQTRLVEDLLDLSRAMAGHLTVAMTDVDLPVVLREAVESLRPAADEAGVALEYQPASDLGRVRGDPGRIQQVINNLVGNGIKFTPRGGRVTLRAERDADTLVMTVQDTGIGMDPGFVPHVFDRFRQADSSTTRSHSGAGLGLAISRHLVELHRGTIEARSEGLGRGSTFTVRLPARPPAG